MLSKDVSSRNLRRIRDTPSLTHALSDSGAESVCYAFHEKYLPGKNVSGISVLARLSDRAKSFSRIKKFIDAE